MADEITIKPKSETSTSADSNRENQKSTLDRTQAINLCAVGLAVSFFLPWANFFGFSPSGFDLQKMGDEKLLLWLIPAFCLITIIAGLAKQSQQIAGQLTGLLPFLVGVYWFVKLGSDLLDMLMYGAYLSLIFGAALFILPRRQK